MSETPGDATPRPRSGFSWLFEWLGTAAVLHLPYSAASWLRYLDGLPGWLAAGVGAVSLLASLAAANYLPAWLRGMSRREYKQYRSASIDAHREEEAQRERRSAFRSLERRLDVEPPYRFDGDEYTILVQERDANGK